ncbi:MAG: hypothetical protein ACI4JM_11560 [Oscillospiraceae bacterium]
MKRILLLFCLSILLTSCGIKPSDNKQVYSADASNDFHFWFPEQSDENSDIQNIIEQTSVQEIYQKSTDIFGSLLSDKNIENKKIRIAFDKDGNCSIIDSGGFDNDKINQLISGISCTDAYIEINLDSRFSDGIGIALTTSDIPDKMPDSYNFADGVFDGELQKIETYPVLEKGTSLAEYEYSSMEECIAELNQYAEAGMKAAANILNGTDDKYDSWYISAYGTAHTVLCSDENGIWSINSEYNNGILTDECTQRIIDAFNSDSILSSANNCTIQLMFYMERFAGVSANYSADEKYFTTYDVSFWEPYKAPYEESYNDKSFMNWEGIDGCLKGSNGRLCPVGTYCIETEAPLNVYIPLSVMGEWKIVKAGDISFDKYAAEMSDGYTDYTTLVCKITESRLFFYCDSFIDLYDIKKTDNGYDVLYNTSKCGSIVQNGNGSTITLYLRHSFTGNDMTLPLVLEKYTADETEYKTDYIPKKENEQLSSEEWIARDTEENNLLDLSGERVVGDEITNPNVLSDYRKYVSDGGSYTLEMYCTGAERFEYYYYTYDGRNGYERWDLTEHNGDEEPMGWETIYMNNKIYYCGYELDRYDLRKYDCYDNSEGDVPYSSLLSENENNPMTFVKAYNVTVGGTAYTAEEWKTGNSDNVITVYSIDGIIKGYEDSFHGQPVVYTVTKLEKQADTELIRIPERINNVDYGD